MWPFKNKKEVPSNQPEAPKLYAPYYRLSEVPNRELYGKVCEMFRTMEPEFEQMFEVATRDIHVFQMFRFPSSRHCVAVRKECCYGFGSPAVCMYTVVTRDGSRTLLCREIYEGMSRHEPSNVSELHDLVSKREGEALKRKTDGSAAKAMEAVNEALGRR